MEQDVVAYIGNTIYLGAAKAKDDAVVSKAMAWLNAETDALRANGFNEDQVKFNLVKDWMESGAYTSTGAKVNNPGNIMFGKHNINATKGPYLSGNKTYLAAYKSLGDYAKDLKRVLSLSPGRPIDARGYPDLTDFVKRLKANNYFGNESIPSYLGKMQGAQQRLRIISQFQEDTHQEIVTPGGGDGFTRWWEARSMVEKVGIGAAAFVAIVILTKR